ncbi:unnamed protein product [Diamesa tonsa]
MNIKMVSLALVVLCLAQYTVAEEDSFWKKAWSKTTDIASTVGDKVSEGWVATKESVGDFVSADGAGGKAYNRTASSVGEFVSADGTGGQAYNSTKNYLGGLFSSNTEAPKEEEKKEGSHH